MRIYSEDLDRTLDSVTLILTIWEMEQVRDFAKSLLVDPSIGHAHVLCEDFSQENQKEIVLTSLEAGLALGDFPPRMQQVLDLDT